MRQGELDLRRDKNGQKRGGWRKGAGRPPKGRRSSERHEVRPSLSPSEPQHVRVLTKALDNNSELAWDTAAFAPPGTTYEVVWRDSTDMHWTHVQSAGAETRIKLNVSKDNVLFGVRSVDAAGHRSLPVPPVPARQ